MKSAFFFARINRASAPLRRLLSIALLVAGLTPGVSRAAGEETEKASPAAGTLAVMTFNLRYASTTRPNAWPDRRPVMSQLIKQAGPDLIGTQEGLYSQLKDLAVDLPEYAWIGLGRDGGSRGEFMAIFYRTSRLEPLEYDHFWLSDTPNVMGSTTWGNTNRRMVTWVRFQDRQTGRQFYYWNTHLDHQIQLAREKAARLIRERVEALKTKLPIVLAGDFNAAAGVNPAYDILVNPEFFSDTWNQAAQRRGQLVGTFHNFSGLRDNGPRIDWILDRGPIEVDAIEIITFQKSGQYPSDHFPVMAWIRLK